MRGDLICLICETLLSEALGNGSICDSCSKPVCHGCSSTNEDGEHVCVECEESED